MAAKVVSFINLKGGVGKTTLALAIGEWLAFGMGIGQKVLMIDIDAQYNLASSLLPVNRLEDLWAQGKSVSHMFKAALDDVGWDINDSIVTNCSNVYGNGNLHALISSRALGQLDNDILDRWKKLRPVPSLDLRLVLGEHLKKVKGNYQWVIIDCPPSLSIFTSNAILCSDYWIAPLIPEALSLYGIGLIQDRITELQNEFGAANVKIDFRGSILNRIDISRGDHTKEAAKVYNSSAFYQPFDCWVGDWKPLYIVSDYGYPRRQHQENLRSHPEWSNLEEKYGGRSRAENNADSLEKLTLQRKLGLGSTYLIADVVRGLAMEFKQRCK